MLSNTSMMKNLLILLFHLPLVKSGNFWGAPPCFIEFSDSGVITLIVAQSYTSKGAGVLFLTDCKDTADIVFHKDKNHTNICTDTVRLDHKDNFDVSQKRSYLYHQSQIGISPEKWDLIMFPSFLKSWPQKTPFSSLCLWDQNSE